MAGWTAVALALAAALALGPSIGERAAITAQDDLASHAVAASGDLVALGVGPRVQLLRVDGAGTLEPLGRTEALPGVVRDLVISAERDEVHAALALDDEGAGAGGVLRLDVADPTAPRQSGHLELGPVHGLALDARGVLLAAGSAERDASGNDVTGNDLTGALHVLATQGAELEPLARLSFAQALVDVAWQGTQALVLERASASGRPPALRMLDLRDPAAPRRQQALGLDGAASAVEAGAGVVRVSAGAGGLYSAEIRPDPRRPLGTARRWVPPGCVGASVSAGIHQALLDACEGRIRLLQRLGGRMRQVAEAQHGRPMADAAWSGDVLLVAEGEAGGLSAYRWDGRELLPAGSFRPDAGLDAAMPAASGVGDAGRPGHGSVRAGAEGARAARARTQDGRIFIPYAAASPYEPSDVALERGASVGGESMAIAAFQEQVFVGEGRDLVVLRAAGEALEPWHRVPLPGGQVWDLHVRDDRLYAAAGEAGLVVFQLRAGVRPWKIAQMRTGGPAFEVNVDPARDLAFVAAWDAGLEVYDLSRGALRRRSALQAPGNVRGLLRVGDVAYLIRDGRPPGIADLQDPDRPSWIGPLGGDVDWPPLLFAQRGHLYHPGWELSIWDIADPRSPRALPAAREIELDDAWAVAVDGARDRAYLAHRDGLATLDLSDPASPSLLPDGSLPRRLTDLSMQADRLLAARSRVPTGRALASEDGRPFAVAGGGALELDAQACCAPARSYVPALGMGIVVPTIGRGDARYLIRTDDVVDPVADGVHLLDLSRPESPRVGPEVDAPFGTGLIVHKGHAFQPFVFGDVPRLEVYDLSNPARPSFEIGYPLPRNSRLYWLGEGRAALTRPGGGSDDTTGLSILDLSRPPQVQFRPWTEVAGRITGGRASGSWMAATVETYDRSEGARRWIQAIDVGGRGAARPGGRTALPADLRWAGPTALDGDMAVIATDRGLLSAQLRGHAEPRLLGLGSGRAPEALLPLAPRRWLALGRGAALVDTRDAPRLQVPAALDSVAMEPHILGRSAARSGDWLYVTTVEGGAGAATYDTEIVRLR